MDKTLEIGDNIGMKRILPKSFIVQDALNVRESVHTVTDRIGTRWSNVGKKQKIREHFEAVQTIKNQMATFAFQHIPLLETPDFITHGYQYFQKTLEPDLQKVLTAWELQQLFHKVVCAHTLNHVQQILTLSTFHLSKGKMVQKKDSQGKLTWKSRSAYGPLATFLNTLRFHTIEGPEAIPERWRRLWDHYSQKFSEQRLLNLLRMHQENVQKRIHPIYYTSGSYMKAAQFNKKAAKPTWHSHWIKNDTCRRYQNWYVFKSPEWVLHLPLSVNQKYHNKPYDLTKEHWVTLNPRGEVDISLVYDRTDVMLKPNKAVGIGLNVKTNLFAVSNGLFFSMENQWLQKQEAKLALLEKKGYQNLNMQEHLTLKKITRHRESSLRYQIQQVLLKLKSQQVTDVILENLTITLGGGLSHRMHKILRLLRFGTIRTWMRQQAHKLGMRIHDFPSAYSSQACSCGNIDPNSRRNQQFQCTVCQHTEHADIHAGNNLLFLFEQARDVLARDGFLSINGFGEYVSTVKCRLQYRLIQDYYRKASGSHIQGGILVIDHSVSLGGNNPCPLGQGT
ncbi:transposase [Acidithiobacillus thiooxidans]|uniref:zinc ribbon domain-containing protein n=1 Tax=Acidithiobacillus thiooxidans TaxID=930 RepID=UPI001C076C4D|nr:zinc ribbon domain-containing protein [Acidithiobacillus thiooxidans]MBU2792742.1 transposase [Acidithiobacillus thiooxidans]